MTVEEESIQTDLFGVERRPNATELLTTLALINVNWEVDRRSYLDNFVPFLLQAIRDPKIRSWNEVEAQTQLARTFGLEVPSKVVGSLLRRAVRRGFAVRDTNRYTLTTEGRGDGLAAVESARADCRRQQRNLASSLATMVSGRFGLQWTVGEAEEVLASYIEQHAVPLLAASTRGAAIEPLEVPLGTEYIVSVFVAEIADSNAELFKYLDQMVKGSMLASALYVSVQADVNRRFSNTTLYLDAPVCLKALGLEGREAEVAARQVIAMAIRQGASVACFEHSVKEVVGVLDSAKSALSSGVRRADELGVLAHLRASGTTASDVELMIERIEQKIEALGLRIETTPPYLDRLGVDEKALEEKLQKGVGYLHHPSLVTDLNSLTAIHRLRGGSSPRQLERCRAVLITDNDRLAAVGKSFFDRTEHLWPVVMMENDLAALVWVKEPQRFPELPRAQVIADCYAALSPSPSLWHKVSEEIDRLQARGAITEDDVAILRYSHEASTAIMDATLGEPTRVTAPTIREALAQAKTMAAEPVARERDEALVRALTAEADGATKESARQALVGDLEIAHGEVNVKAGQVAELSAQLDALRRREADMRTSINDRAIRSARRARRIILAIAVVVTAVGAASLIPEVAAGMSGPILFLARCAAVLAFVATVFGTVTDGSKRFEDRFAELDEARRLRSVGLR
ncbi:MAG: hypothetical protein LCH96_17650 [Actinobacteria bacterium]|nr:hypothetical protein [Actinomycetota bacterium]